MYLIKEIELQTPHSTFKTPPTRARHTLRLIKSDTSITVQIQNQCRVCFLRSAPQLVIFILPPNELVPSSPLFVLEAGAGSQEGAVPTRDWQMWGPRHTKGALTLTAATDQKKQPFELTLFMAWLPCPALTNRYHQLFWLEKIAADESVNDPGSKWGLYGCP